MAKQNQLKPKRHGRYLPPSRTSMVPWTLEPDHLYVNLSQNCFGDEIGIHVELAPREVHDLIGVPIGQVAKAAIKEAATKKNASAMLALVQPLLDAHGIAASRVTVEYRGKAYKAFDGTIAPIVKTKAHPNRRARNPAISIPGQRDGVKAEGKWVENALF